MATILIYGLIYFGSALMVYNIYCYIRFSQQIRQRGNWSRETRLLALPILLLVMFLVGYLAVGLFGHPDWIIAGILSGGSVFVWLMILFLQVVTKRIYEHEHLESKLMAAEEVNRAKTSFFATISHEMRTPMNAIIGFDVMALKDSSLSPHAREHLEKIGTSARHLLGLINDILEMSRIEAGQLTLKQEPMVLSDVMEQINTMVSDQCAEKGLEYRSSIIGIVDDYYLGDELKLKQVLLNLLSNAIKFTPSPGSVDFTAEQLISSPDGCILRFQVKDTGIGIGEEFLPHVFEPFSKEDDSHSTLYSGSGLGLAIAWNITGMMGGKLSVKSTKDAGSVFTVTVTLMPDPNGATLMKEAAAVESVSLDGMHLLLAEDMEINAELLMELLSLEGVTCEWAKNGQEAVDLFRNNQPDTFDAVLMDIRMPVMDGLAATRAIRTLPREDAGTVPIIALTANAFEEDVEQAIAAGMNIHLSKPVDPDLLYQTLGRLVLKRK